MNKRQRAKRLARNRQIAKNLNAKRKLEAKANGKEALQLFKHKLALRRGAPIAQAQNKVMAEVFTPAVEELDDPLKKLGLW